MRAMAENLADAVRDRGNGAQHGSKREHDDVGFIFVDLLHGHGHRTRPDGDDAQVLDLDRLAEYFGEFPAGEPRPRDSLGVAVPHARG